MIVDHLMPGGTGIEFAREVRRARADVSIILLSGYTGPLLTHEALSAGIQRIVTKPLELEALAEAIAHLLAPAPRALIRRLRRRSSPRRSFGAATPAGRYKR